MTSANSSKAGASLSEKKKNLRKSITARLRALDDSYVAAEVSRLFPRLLALDEYKDSTCVSLYLSMPAKEVPTFPDLLEIVMTDGKRAERRARDVYVPKALLLAIWSCFLFLLPKT
ncbi:5-formyltetrahydrofolate cyclo-ligase [Nannochloropsis gaditana CCMP526]|uniref:5-formyltetrahydrofolate cyclo-ligase n=1 Tax=Nannochloropsis gaditana (strain CCMP526) TaxID=1093141 RepID=UPI00029F6D23|nr:5-formyltetrahydrofolate cyclo-ligase [Nannochloropsis gaditana CCMP526]EKU21034.1 5-formyltetrahydrofolate cyclo-ligase [Nannochloropsis gaditana CCMP526]|eukprot:XP_005855329.1 5-formyltetrahydrofolate cyclo-ligase [Nannochloropsis gaditana CCMP526]